MLDFVPNHTAPDHPWVEEHPEHYVVGSESDLAEAPQNYIRVKQGQGDRVLAFGRVRIEAAGIGRETVTYVSNIFKYYVAYLLIQGEYIERRGLKQTAAPK
jgi:hypothetical protein